MRSQQGGAAVELQLAPNVFSPSARGAKREKRTFRTWGGQKRRGEKLPAELKPFLGGEWMGGAHPLEGQAERKDVQEEEAEIGGTKQQDGVRFKRDADISRESKSH